VDVPIGLLPSTGFTPDHYGVNMWPRTGAPFSGNPAISDFGPDNATFVADLPEPASLGLVATGLAAVGAARRRRRELAGSG
jgi:hypothetical protein